MKRQYLARCLLAVVWVYSVVGVLAQTAATPETKVHMTLLGERMGAIAGEVVQAGREGTHKLLAYSHEIVSPRDPASGLPTGKRQHQPFRVVKLINRSSPLLLQVLATNERLTTVTIDLWVMSQAGKESLMLSYTLTNARLVSVRPWMPNKSDASTATYPPAEELAFTYQKIAVTFHDGGVTAEDDWVAPAS